MPHDPGRPDAALPEQSLVEAARSVYTGRGGRGRARRDGTGRGGRDE